LGKTLFYLTNLYQNEHRTMPPILYLFALTNLVIGTGAFVLSGILKPMSEGLGVSVAATGQAMTAYAMASAFLAPLLLVAVGQWPRKRASVRCCCFWQAMWCARCRPI
jgi:MFS transporter, DHA1 family, inner membrane transport protein